MGLADLRGDDLQDPVPQDPQLPGVVVDGVPDQGHLRIRPDLCGRGRRAAPRPPRRSPGPGRPAADPPPAPPGPARTPRTERGGEPGLAVRRGTGLLRGVRPPVRRRGGTASRLPPPRSGRGGRPGAAARRSGPPAGSARPSPPGHPPGSSTRPVRPGPSSGCRRIWAAADRIGCARPVVSAVLAMDQFDHSSADILGHVDRRLWTTSTTPSLVDAKWAFRPMVERDSCPCGVSTTLAGARCSTSRRPPFLDGGFEASSTVIRPRTTRR